MPTYTPIIRYLLWWQLALPVLIVLTGIGWLWALITMGFFMVLYKSKYWESNSYSRYGALAVIVSSVLFAIVTLANGSDTMPNPLDRLLQGHTTISELLTPWTEYLSMVLWLFSMVAFTATSPYPLGIRMPVVVYTVFYLLVGKGISGIEPLWLLCAAVVFAFLMLTNLSFWKRQSKSQTLTKTSEAKQSTDQTSPQNLEPGLKPRRVFGVGNNSSSVLMGPPEPPFSFSLATAIVLILVLALSAGICGLFWMGPLLDVTPLVLVSCIIIWLLSAKDWKKNPLAISALVLILTSNITSIAAIYIHNQTLRAIAFMLLVAPVIFHTTAPVFRGMRITITLYATYNAFCKSVFGQYLLALFPDIPQLPTYGFIAFDAGVLLTLILMALHWKRTKKVSRENV